MDFSIKYGGRAFGFTVIVNTDEDPTAICNRLQAAARGEKLNAVIVGAYKVEPLELKEMLAAAAREALRHGRPS